MWVHIIRAKIIIETLALIYSYCCRSKSFNETIEIIDSDNFSKFEISKKREIYQDAIINNPKYHQKIELTKRKK